MISVIVPVYNVEKYIHRCIDSILDQTFTDFELILVDDGSPDNCGKICDDYAKKDRRIHVINKENGGLSDARNAGLDWVFANSSSEWITYIDSDDWIHPCYLETLYNAVTESRLRISSCLVKRTPTYYIEDLAASKFTVESSEDVYTQFGKHALSYAVARLYHRSLFEKVRYPKGRLFEDVFTTYRLLLSVDKIAYIPQELYYYFYNENGIVHQQWLPKRMDEFDAYEEQLEFLRQHPEFQKTYKAIQKGYMQEICYSYYKLKNSNYQDKDKYLSILSEKMRSAIKQYKKLSGISLKNNIEYYEIAYPKQMIHYWRYLALKKKVLKRTN